MLMLTNLHHPGQNLFVWQAFLQKRGLQTEQAFFFFLHKKACLKRSFCLRRMKNKQHQHKGKLYTLKKSQDAATSMEDAVTYSVHSSGMENSCLCT
jgi:hypothetical protein